MPMLRLIFRVSAAVAALLSVSLAYGKDFGVQGNIWPIVEKDIRQIIMESAADVDWTAIGDDVRKKAETFVERLPKRTLPEVEATRTVWVDPSIELSTDIQVPVKQPDGSLSWEVLYKRGTKVNPLNYFRPVTAMLFVNTADEEQLGLAKAVAAIEPDRIMIVEAGQGDVKKASEAMARIVFHANDALLSRFSVRYLPTLVYPGTGAQREFIGVTSFARPFQVKEVIAAWPELTTQEKVNSEKPE